MEGEKCNLDSLVEISCVRTFFVRTLRTFLNFPSSKIYKVILV